MIHQHLSEIQHGWKVFSSDGVEVGKVVAPSVATLRVKKGGLFGGEIILPASAVAAVETDRVDLSLTKKDIDAGW